MPEAHELDDEDDDEGTPDVEPEPVERPRATRAASAVQPEVPTPFGKVPARATTWGIRRRTELGAWETMKWQSPDGLLLVTEWPPADLNHAEVEKRWGPGHYKVSWWGLGSQGGRQMLGSGREFTILPRPEAAPSIVAAVSEDPVMAGLERAFRLQAILDGRAQQQLATQAQMMQMMMGVGGGASGEVAQLRAEMARMQQQHADDRVHRLEAELAQLRSKLVDDTPAEPGPVAAAAGVVAKAGARRVFNNRPIGESLQGAFSTWVAEDPIAAAGQIVEVVKTIPSALEAVSRLLAGVQQPQQQAPAQLAPAAPMPPERSPSPPPPPSPGAFSKPDTKPRAVRVVPPIANGAPPSPSPSALAPTEPPPVSP
jgi:hypothetical protein